MNKVFIDGSSGTAGLQIYDRLKDRDDISLMLLSDADRKIDSKRSEALNSCDIAILCLPDDAAKQAVGMTLSPNTRIIDCSTAHRTAPGWVYGFPELVPGGADIIRNASRVANPGCHASGFIALVSPLTAAGIVPKNALITCHSITGYSGGGKKMISQYETPGRDALLDAPRQYGLTQQHKHLAEMRHVCEMDSFPVFCPIVSDFYSGMCVTVPLFSCQINGSAADIRAVYRDLYTGPVVNYIESPGEDGFLSGAALAKTDRMEISVLGNDERILLIARFDNLGKGAAGSAVENLNIMLGAPQTKGLAI